MFKTEVHFSSSSVRVYRKNHFLWGRGLGRVRNQKNFYFVNLFLQPAHSLTEISCHAFKKRKACSVEALWTWASGDDIYFIIYFIIYFSPAKLWHNKGPHATLTEGYWHLSVRIKFPADCSGQLRLFFQGSEITLSLAFFFSLGESILLIW